MSIATLISVPSNPSSSSVQPTTPPSSTIYDNLHGEHNRRQVARIVHSPRHAWSTYYPRFSNDLRKQGGQKLARSIRKAAEQKDRSAASRFSRGSRIAGKTSAIELFPRLVTLGRASRERIPRSKTKEHDWGKERMESFPARGKNISEKSVDREACASFDSADRYVCVCVCVARESTGRPFCETMGEVKFERESLVLEECPFWSWRSF